MALLLRIESLLNFFPPPPVGALRMPLAERAQSNAVQTTQFLSTPDSSGKPLSEAKSLERIAGKGSEKNYLVNRSITGGVTPVDENPPSWKRFCMVT